MSRDTKIEKIKDYLKKQNDVVMAFVFGSQAKGNARRASDWDIGIYLTEESRAREQEMWAHLEELLETEVDLVVLNRAPAPLAWTIVRAGTPLIINDRRRYLQFLIYLSHEANAWYKTAEDYHRVFERSRSLAAEDSERLKRIIQFLEQETGDWGKFKKLSWQEYANDRAKKREVERWAEQLVNAVIDTAEIILASERRVIPETYRLIVRTLGTLAPFDQDDVCENISQWIELRNILAHEYLDYRWKELSAFIEGTEPLFQKFTDNIKDFLLRKIR